MRAVVSWLSGLALLASATASAEISDNEIRIGLVTDMSSIYKEVGQYAEIAARMALEDVGGEVAGKKIRLYVRDHKVDTKTAMAHAKELHEELNVDMFLEMVGTNVSVPMQRYARENDILAIHTGSASSVLTGRMCSPVGIHWAYDTYSLAGGTAAAVVEEGYDSWYFITVDDLFGETLQREATDVIKRFGGKVVGTAKHPQKATDFTSQLADAVKSGAKVIAVANGGHDTGRALRQAYEMGVMQGDQMLVGLLVTEGLLIDVGQYALAGIKLITGFYWNLDDQTRAWSKRFLDRAGIQPTMYHASVYSALMQYFKAVEETGSDDPKTIVANLRSKPLNDVFLRNGKLREDGRLVHDMYLVEFKKPSENKGFGDIYNVLKVIPGDKAFRPLEDGECPLVTKKS